MTMLTVYVIIPFFSANILSTDSYTPAFSSVVTYLNFDIVLVVQQARPLLTKTLEEQLSDELVDPKLGANYDEHGMQRLIACAAAAVRHTARSRPRMSQVKFRTFLDTNLLQVISQTK